MRSRPRAFRVIAGGLLMLELAGCYEYAPPQSATITAGNDVSMSITDQGRVALSESIGSGLRRVRGQLLSENDSTFVVAATAFEFVDMNIPVQANGKRVDLARSFVTDIRVKRLSKKKSWLAAGLVVAGAVLASTIAIVGFGSDTGDQPGGGGGVDQ